MSALPDHQSLCLQALARAPACPFDSGGSGYVPFAYVMRMTGLPRNVVRTNVRRLARKGLAEFRAGLWNEDGGPAGAGYRLTAAGRDRAAKITLRELAYG